MIYAWYGPVDELGYLQEGDVCLPIEGNGVQALYRLAACDGLIITAEPPYWIRQFCEQFRIPIYTKDKGPDRSRTLEAYPVQAVAFRAVASYLFRMHLAKNDDYGPGNLLALGGHGIVVRLFDKVARLLNLLGYSIRYRFLGLTAQFSPRNEAISDTYLDLAAYAILGYLESMNFLGK